jgi:amino acid adenylation domain-containing protein/thioester reductase-like protein
MKKKLLAPSQKKAVIVGETNVCIKCIESLSKRGWLIIAVISDDPEVADMAKSHNIPLFHFFELETIQERGFYLFSIINPYIIQEKFLDSRNVILGINYHDSFLPKYAGINSTTWAILNNEKYHGITFHKIAKDIDSGEIFAQSKIEMQPNETALSLNLKCSEVFLYLFDSLIEKIESVGPHHFKQNALNRTYYGLKHLPNNYGIVNGIKNFTELNKITRGLHFGDGYDNPVASVKIFIQEKFYIIEYTNENSMQWNYFLLSGGFIVFENMRDIYGNPVIKKIAFQDYEKLYTLQSDELNFLSDIKKNERRNKYFLKNLLDKDDTSLRATYFCGNNSREICLSQKLHFPKYLESDEIIALVYILLSRFFGRKFLASIYYSDESIPKNLRKLVERKGFLCVEREKLEHGFESLKTYLFEQQENIFTLTKDFAYRYHLNLLTDISIVIGETSITDQHKLIVRIHHSAKISIESAACYEPLFLEMILCAQKLISDYIENGLKDANLLNLNILNDTQYKKVTSEFNSFQRYNKQSNTIHEWFEKQVAKIPRNIAISCESGKLTYAELNAQANRMAKYIGENYEVKSDDLIIVCLDDTLNAIVSLLAVLKAGGAYVPLEPTCPDKRIAYVLADTRAKLIITQEKYSHRLCFLSGQKKEFETNSVLSVDNMDVISNIQKYSEKNCLSATTGNNLIYAIYTSGTTGNPKGVLVEHKSVVAYVSYLIKDNRLDATSIGSKFAGFSFDASVIEVFPILLSGGMLCMIPNKHKESPHQLNEFFIRNRISYAFLPTQFGELFFHTKNSTLSNLIIGGDKLNTFSSQTYRVVNAYGPTEATVQSTAFVVDKPYDNIPIGRPIPTAHCYIVDEYLNPVPIGVVGELVIGGESLARGYLNLPELTKEKFIANPFQSPNEKKCQKNERLYKTGDLARWLPDGNIQYIGRDDSQVKIRGYRVEINEVIAKLQEIDGVRQALVISLDDVHNKKFLCAYYTAKKMICPNILTEKLAKHLNPYMIPQSFVFLNKFPVNFSGKINRHLLPYPDYNLLQDYVAPMSHQEQLICAAYEKILGLQKVGINDDFFSFGGDSIKAILLVSRLRSSLDLTISEVFELRTPRQLAKSISFDNKLLHEKLQEIALCYKNSRFHKTREDTAEKIAHPQSLPINFSCIDIHCKKSINTVLLTGATGFLGCNLLNQLLELTEYNIFLIVRATSDEEAFERVNSIFNFYFGKNIYNFASKRVRIFCGDIENSMLGLPSGNYDYLIHNVDSIIHAAALVKHFGSYQAFYRANVEATNNLLDFCQTTKAKDFHYISTYSIFNAPSLSAQGHIFSEDDEIDYSSIEQANLYIKTKRLGELAVIARREHGVRSNIYRVGNLAFIMKNGRAQKNIEDNSFFNQIKCFIHLGIIPKEIGITEISPADFTAQAIVKLFDKTELVNSINHVFNHNRVNIAQFLSQQKKISVKVSEINEFIQLIQQRINTPDDNYIVERFLLHKEWLNNQSISTHPIFISQYKTSEILSQLKFEWLPIQMEHFSLYIENNFIKQNQRTSSSKSITPK